MQDGRRSGSLLALAGFAAGAAAAAWFGARYSPAKPGRTRDWYNHLDKPFYNPPRAVFPVVWPVLYGLMTWSAWRVWRAESSPARSKALALWTAQLATNAAWSKLFFGDRRPDLALLDSLAMKFLIASYIDKARKVDGYAAAAFVPYLAWVSFANLLNAEIARRNPVPRPLAA
jgi:benzodiazapine receptor